MTDDAATWAAHGDPDDARTFMAVLVELDGAIAEINARVAFLPDGPQAALIAADAWDGLDGAGDIGTLRAALEVLLYRAGALRDALEEEEEER